MHVLMVSDVFFPRVNGVSTSIQTFARSFLKLGHSVALIAPDYPNSQPAEFEIIRIHSMRLPFDPEDRLMSLRAIKRLVPRLRDRGFDLIHIQTPFVAHYAGRYLGRELSLPTVVSYHTFFEAYFEKYLPWVPSSWLRSVARLYSRRQCNEVDGVISPSHPMLERLREYGVTTRAEVIPTGLPLEQFRLQDDNGFRQRYGLDADDFVMLFVGRVAFEKNIEFLMSMFGRVRRRFDKVKLVVAGEGPALASLKKRALEIRLERDILFIGYLDRSSALMHCYQACDLFVFASETETQGLVLLEAMACGLPAVSTASMGTKDVLREGQGCLIAPSEEQAFAERVVSLLEDPARTRELAETGLDYVRQWSTEAKAGEMLEFYQQTIGLENTGPPPVEADVVSNRIQAKGG